MRKIRITILVLGFLALALAPLLLLGCAGVIASKTNQSHGASYDPQDKGKASSGIIAIVYDDHGNVIGRKITQHARDRYNALIDLYGDQFLPALKHDAGIDFSGEGDTCVMLQAYYIKFGQMIQWKRDGRKPTGTLQKLINKVTTRDPVIELNGVELAVVKPTPTP